jgi:hypothetical protein
MADTSPAWNCYWHHVHVMASHSVNAGNNVRPSRFGDWQNRDRPGEQRLTDAWSAIHPAIEAMISCWPRLLRKLALLRLLRASSSWPAMVEISPPSTPVTFAPDHLRVGWRPVPPYPVGGGRQSHGRADHHFAGRPQSWSLGGAATGFGADLIVVNDLMMILPITM